MYTNSVVTSLSSYASYFASFKDVAFNTLTNQQKAIAAIFAAAIASLVIYVVYKSCFKATKEDAKPGVPNPNDQKAENKGVGTQGTGGGSTAPSAATNPSTATT